MMPFISSAPAVPPEQAGAANTEIDPAAAEAVFRSYHHRLGRQPTLDELRGALGLETDEPLTVVQAQTGEPSAGFGLIGEANAAPRMKPTSDRPRITPENFGPWSLGALKLHPLLNAGIQTSRILMDMPGLTARLAADAMSGSSPDAAASAAAMGRIDGALRSQAQAYDWWKSDPNKSYQTYSKEREDLGECRYSQKVDPNLPCYYAGHTGNVHSPEDNVSNRDSAQYPSNNYRRAQLDCATSSLMAARAREQEMIDYYRDHGVSDNRINSMAESVWRPYYMEMARQQCGHIPLPAIRRR
jgi:hypothetical protein